MNKLTLKNLENCFESAAKEQVTFVGIAVVANNQEVPEVILNRTENFESKLAYYKNAYNDDLTLKANTNIKIVGFTHANTANEIVADLI